MLVSFPCKRVAAGAATGDASSVVKTIAVVYADGRIDTSTTSNWPYGGTAAGLTAFHMAITNTGATFYNAMAPGYTPSGISAFPYNIATFGTSATLGFTTPAANGYLVRIYPWYTTNPGIYDARCVSIYNGVLYGDSSSADPTFNSIWQFSGVSGNGLPTIGQADNPVIQPGTTSNDPWT